MKDTMTVLVNYIKWKSRKQQQMYAKAYDRYLKQRAALRANPYLFWAQQHKHNPLEEL